MSQSFLEVDRRCYRLIPSKFPPVDIYRNIGSEELKAAAIRLEDLTNPRLADKRRAESSTTQPASPHQFQNWNHAPFVYTNPEGSRYLGPAYGVMDVGLDERAALRMAILRREIFLGRTNEAAAAVEMRVLGAKVTGRFVDLTADSFEAPRADRWARGLALHESGVDGVAYRLPGAGAAVFLSIFSRQVVGKSVQERHYRFTWDGSVISSVYDFGDDDKPIKRAAIFSDDPDLKAA